MANRYALDQDGHSRLELLNECMAAWFPHPEYYCAARYRIEALAWCLSVVHRDSQQSLSQLVDGDILDQVHLRDDAFATMAESMNHELCRKGHSRPLCWLDVPPECEFESIQALCHVAGLKLRAREIQGRSRSSYNGLIIYMVRPDKWVRPVAHAFFEKPFQWWQQHVTSMVTGA